MCTRGMHAVGMIIRRPRSSDKTAKQAAAAMGALAVPMTTTLQSALERLAQRWRCGTERAAQRILVMSLTGWKPHYAELIDQLSRFVPGHDDPFQRTCLMLRNHFDKAEVELGEAVRECDRIAWLETLLESLTERRKEGESAVLAELLADGVVLEE